MAMAKNDRYQVVVGNVGTVYSGNSKRRAQLFLESYMRESLFNPSCRCYGEDVTLMCDDDVLHDHIGHGNPSIIEHGA